MENQNISKGYIHVVDTIMSIPHGTIYEYISNNNKFATLKKAIDTAGLNETLNGNHYIFKLFYNIITQYDEHLHKMSSFIFGLRKSNIFFLQTKCSLSLGTVPFTVFAPNDDAFTRVPANELEDLMDNPVKLLGNTCLPNIDETLSPKIKCTHLTFGFIMCVSITGSSNICVYFVFDNLNLKLDKLLSSLLFDVFLFYVSTDVLESHGINSTHFSADLQHQDNFTTIQGDEITIVVSNGGMSHFHAAFVMEIKI